MNLDEELRRALARETPPRDLVSRIVERLADESPPVRPPRRTGLAAPWAWLATAAVLVLAIGTAGYREHRAEVAEAARVTQDLKVALTIASGKLAVAQQRVRESGERTVPTTDMTGADAPRRRSR